ncbi:hypothetical protein Tco_1395052 [Tanacetum coccineum]
MERRQFAVSISLAPIGNARIDLYIFESCKTRVSYDLVFFREEHQCRFEELGSTYDTILDMIILRIGRLRWMIYLVVLADAAESVRDTIGFEYCLASSSGWTKSPVLWAEIGESSLTGPELVLDTTDKVVLIKEKLKAARDRQKSYADKRRKPLEFEVGDRVLLKVSPWKGVLRLPEELSSVHDTFHVSNLKKCLADANLHVPVNEIKIDTTLRFVEELVEIMDHEIRNLKRSNIPLVKVHWNSKRGLEFTWEREDHMKSKYPQLFVDRVVESAS